MKAIKKTPTVNNLVVKHMNTFNKCVCHADKKKKSVNKPKYKKSIYD